MSFFGRYDISGICVYANDFDGEAVPEAEVLIAYRCVTNELSGKALPNWLVDKDYVNPSEHTPSHAVTAKISGPMIRIVPKEEVESEAGVEEA